MVLARRLAGELNDHQSIELISEILDSPEAIASSLELLPTDEPESDQGQP